VEKGGTISFPLIGSVPVRGKTPTEVERLIAGKLKNGYVKDPNVSVEVVRYRPFFAMGEVNAAGQYSYAPGMTVQSAIATAGGFTPRADKRFATVSRRTGGEVETISLDMTDPIRPGDTIYIQERAF
jgi:polysaccharide export outer membrane protein